MKWFRLYSEILDDPKIQKLSDSEFRKFIYLMCFACELDQAGHIPYPNNEIAWRLRCDDVTMCDALVTLQKLKITSQNDSGIVINHWKKRQYKSDTSVERTRRYRERKKSVTSQKRHTKRHSDALEQIQIQNITPISPKGDDGLFDLFWLNYPNKKGKTAALKAWKKIKKPTEVIEKIKKVLPEQIESESWTKNNGQFIPMPATYLNQGRWDDETI